MTILCPQNTGTSQDALCRIAAEYLEKYLDGTTVIVENMGGAATTVAGAYMYSLDADVDYIINLDAFQLCVAPITNKAVYSYKDYSPLAYITVEEAGIFASATSGLKTWEDVVALHNKNGELIVGTGPVAGSPYAAVRTLLSAANMNMEALVGGNVAEAIVNAIGDRCDICYSGLSLAKSYVDAGQLIPILSLNTDGTDFFGKHTRGTGEVNIDFAFAADHMFCSKSTMSEEKKDFIAKALEKMYADPDFKAAWEQSGRVVLPDGSRASAEKVQKAWADSIPTWKIALGIG